MIKYLLKYLLDLNKMEKVFLNVFKKSDNTESYIIALLNIKNIENNINFSDYETCFSIECQQFDFVKLFDSIISELNFIFSGKRQYLNPHLTSILHNNCTRYAMEYNGELEIIKDTIIEKITNIHASKLPTYFNELTQHVDADAESDDKESCKKVNHIEDDEPDIKKIIICMNSKINDILKRIKNDIAGLF